ncbi:hypothetical protein EXN66_Car022098 [Channa argus]|uniref:Uncharacterized protein n=1 Tax=Channa argus TaxID=215402 RepID=A0A6G1QWF8_CHAAH|nr:hypothetical protein EXN66_Car022098 [Channa argus]
MAAAYHNRKVNQNTHIDTYTYRHTHTSFQACEKWTVNEEQKLMFEKQGRKYQTFHIHKSPGGYHSTTIKMSLQRLATKYECNTIREGRQAHSNKAAEREFPDGLSSPCCQFLILSIIKCFNKAVVKQTGLHKSKPDILLQDRMFW